MFKTEPPVVEAAYRTFIPEQIDPIAIVTLVGGTVGGYITFAGAHRLLDAGVQGEKAMAEVSRSSVSAILIASTMRIVLFLAVLGIVVKGVPLNPKNPAETPFEYVAGNFGQVLFGVVIWAASITSVIGAAYTSVSFLTSLCPTIERNRNRWIIAFIRDFYGCFGDCRKTCSGISLCGYIEWFNSPNCTRINSASCLPK